MGKWKSEKKNNIVHVEDCGLRSGHLWMPCGHEQHILDKTTRALAHEVRHEEDDEGKPYLPGNRTCAECGQKWHNPRVDWYCFTPPAFWTKRFASTKEIAEQRERSAKWDAEEGSAEDHGVAFFDSDGRVKQIKSGAG